MVCTPAPEERLPGLGHLDNNLVGVGEEGIGKRLGAVLEELAVVLKLKRWLLFAVEAEADGASSGEEFGAQQKTELFSVYSQDCIRLKTFLTYPSFFSVQWLLYLACYLR